METFLKWSGLVALVITAIILFFPGSQTTLFGSTSCANITCLSGGLRLVADAGGDFESDVAAVFASTINVAGAFVTTSTIKIGTNGTTVSQLQKGTCALIAPSYTVTGTTTVAMDCAVTGVVSTDTVFAQFATSTPGAAFNNGWLVSGVSASTTAGFLTFNITNYTGATGVIPASVASSTKYLILR